MGSLPRINLPIYHTSMGEYKTDWFLKMKSIYDTRDVTELFITEHILEISLTKKIVCLEIICAMSCHLKLNLENQCHTKLKGVVIRCISYTTSLNLWQ